jgi:prolyl oligopeptidase
MKPSFAPTLLLFAGLGCATASSGVEPQESPLSPPKTPKKEVRDTFHGVEVVEQYRWLEDWNDPEVKGWSEAQNVFARTVLDRLPGRDAIRARVAEILGADVISHGLPVQSGGNVFAMRRHPPKQQPFLVVMPSLDAPDGARVLVDPTVIDPNGHAAIDWFKPSRDGKLVAVSISSGGSEAGDVHVFEVASGKEVHEVVPRVNGGTAGGDLEWAPDASGFYYTRYPRGTERAAEDMAFYQQLWFHKLGTSSDQDRYEIGKEFPRVAEVQIALDRSGRVLASVQNGDGGDLMHWLRGTDGKWKQIARYEDRVVTASFGKKDELWLVSRKDAPRGALYRLPLGADLSKAELVVPQGQDTIVADFWGTSPVLELEGAVFVRYQLGGPSEIRAFDRSGKPAKAPDQKPVSAIYSMHELEDGSLVYGSASYVEPLGWFTFDPKSGATKKTALSTKPVVDLSKLRVVREMALSKDGTKVPVNIILPEGAELDGASPCLVTGYGGYGVSLQPSYQAVQSVLLDQGVIVAVANLRGGGEFGEEWHLQGNLTKKQNVFDDFAAAVRHMIDRKYTSSDRLAIMGGSNGGLLMGATMVQNPGLMKAVVSTVGIYDMLRVELSPNGAFNVTEFGTVKDPDQFKALYAYSPYHHVTDGTAYPATLFMTGANDPRVDPMQSRKMMARLQEASSSKAPLLLRTSADTGHGLGTPLKEQIEQVVDMYSFVLSQLEVEYTPQQGRAILAP